MINMKVVSWSVEARGLCVGQSGDERAVCGPVMVRGLYVGQNRRKRTVWARMGARDLCVGQKGDDRAMCWPEWECEGCVWASGSDRVVCGSGDCRAWGGGNSSLAGALVIRGQCLVVGGESSRRVG